MYDIPANWRAMCDGQGCECCAWNRDECGCDADWTTEETYKLREEVNALHARMQRMRDSMDVWAAHIKTEAKKPIDGAVSTVA